MSRLLFALLTLFALMVLCGCEQTKGNTPATKSDTVVPQSSMESAYKGGGAPGKAQPPR